MLKNKQTLTIIVVLLVLIGGLSYLKFSSKSQSTTPPTQPATQKSSSTPQQKLSDWFKSNKSVVCTIDNNGTKTTIYIDGNKVRIDGFSQDNNSSSSYIQDGQYAYMWDNQKLTGIKYPLMNDEDQSSNETETNNPSQSQPFDLKSMEQAWSNMNYRCEPKHLDSSLFTPPSNVKFNDMSQFMQNMPNLGQ